MPQVGPFIVSEVVGLVVALVGMVLVFSQYKPVTRLFSLGYVLLVVGMFATNAEAIMFPVFLNFVEHVVGIGLAGLVFFIAGYRRRQSLLKNETRYDE